MSDRRLQVFYTVAKLLSFTKAAETLHMTQPAVTFQVRQLEDHFNTRLFDRTHNKILLTDAGQKVFFYAEKIFELNTEMEHSLRALVRGYFRNPFYRGKYHNCSIYTSFSFKRF